MPNYNTGPYDGKGGIDPDYLKKPYKEKNTLIQNFSMVVPCRRWKGECPDQQVEPDQSQEIPHETPIRGVGII